MNGVYAEMFEEEYKDVIGNLQVAMEEDDYMKYLSEIPAEKTHAGYFSIDKKGKMIDSKANEKRENTKEKMSNDVDAYDLIMKNKELLLDRNPKKSPVRFIFSHSALREGWDNPNVFQICTLKQSSSDVRKRQEVGRGLRLCVNQDGERMDTNVLGNDVHNVNILTVIASESYDSFAKGLQSEIAEAVADRPKAVTEDLFIGKVLKDTNGNEQVVDIDTGTELDTNTNVAVYVKLPDGFYISTPVGHYNPDWAIAFYEGTVKHIYFVAETKGSMNSMQLRLVEDSKIHCAREHFKAISNGDVVYDVVDSYKELLDIVTK